MSEASERQAEMDAAIAAVWRRMRGGILARFPDIEAALREVATGEVSDDLRERAIQEAHKLAGSLGMFGFPHGSTLTRTIEKALAQGLDAQSAARYAERLRELQAELEA